MIHTIHTMTLRRYGELDHTENLKLLKRWYNPFPVKWFNTEKFFQDVKEIFGNKSSNLRNETYRIISFNRIVILDRMLKTMTILMQDHNTRNLFGYLYQIKVNTESNLPFYIEQVKRITGIEVKDGKDLERLQKKVQFLLDKYNERYPPDKKQPEKVDMMDIFIGVFDIMETPMNERMTLYEFGRLKERADKRLKAKEKHGRKHK